MKRGRKPKYKTAAARMKAKNEKHKRWRERNSDKLKEYQRNWHKAHYVPKSQRPESIKAADLDERMTKLEPEVKEILASLDEISKEQRRLNDEDKWGKK